MDREVNSRPDSITGWIDKGGYRKEKVSQGGILREEGPTGGLWARCRLGAGGSPTAAHTSPGPCFGPAYLLGHIPPALRPGTLRSITTNGHPMPCCLVPQDLCT